MEVTATQCTCLRCGHKWYPRPGLDGVLRRPVQCAKCHSGLWDRPREVRT